MSTSFLLALVLVVLIGCGLALLISAKGDALPYVKSASLFSAAERAFLGVLDQAAPAGYRVFGKVRVADVVNVMKTANRKAWRRAFNQISAKHFDYVLCRADDLSVACAVELDDKSHARPDRKKRDDFIDEVCSVTGLPLLRVAARHAYSAEDIRQQLSALLGPAYGTAIAPPGPATIGLMQVAAQDAVDAALAGTRSAGLATMEPDRTQEPDSLAPACPKCSGTMQRRRLTSGTKAGSEFWGCNDFPDCRGSIPIA